MKYEYNSIFNASMEFICMYVCMLCVIVAYNVTHIERLISIQGAAALIRHIQLLILISLTFFQYFFSCHSTGAIHHAEL